MSATTKRKGSVEAATSNRAVVINNSSENPSMNADIDTTAAPGTASLSRRRFIFNTAAAGAATVAAIPAMEAAKAQPALTPDQRIEAAVAEVIAVYREKYPDCPIRVHDTDNGDKGMLLIVTHVGDEKQGTTNIWRDGAGRFPA